MKKKAEKQVETKSIDTTSHGVIAEMSKGFYVLKTDTTTSRPFSSLESIKKRFPYATLVGDDSCEVIADERVVES